ncbi:hypothetical protein TSH64_02485 [Azospirillum sp. TSH64]|nr:hypothetical protein TSH64_02485 [Azospirillum sp. TSH64]
MTNGRHNHYLPLTISKGTYCNHTVKEVVINIASTILNIVIKSTKFRNTSLRQKHSTQARSFKI